MHTNHILIKLCVYYSVLLDKSVEFLLMRGSEGNVPNEPYCKIFLLQFDMSPLVVASSKHVLTTLIAAGFDVNKHDKVGIHFDM